MTAAAQPVRARYFQIGFRRCGTTALAAFFNRCGIPCVHHDGGRLARRMRDNLKAGRAPLDGYDRRYAAVTNIDFQTPTDHFGFRHFDALLAACGGRCILNTRPVDHWLESVMRNADRPRLRAAYRSRFGTGDPREIAGHWRAAWEEHHRRVLAEVPADRLPVFEIEADPPERLCDFIGVPRACAGLYTLENPRMSRFADALAARLPGPLRRAAPDGVRRRVTKLLRRRP